METMGAEGRPKKEASPTEVTMLWQKKGRPSPSFRPVAAACLHNVHLAPRSKPHSLAPTP